MVTRELLLDAAERVFRRRGVSHSSLAEVAAEAAVTRGAIYWHFKDKADLFDAMLRRAQMPIDAALAEMNRNTAARPLEVLRDFAVLALKNLAESRRTQAVFDIVFLRCEYTAEMGNLRKRQLKARASCLGKCESMLEEAVKSGALPPDTDTKLASQSLFAYVSGIMRTWVEAPKAFDLMRTASALIDSHLAGLRASPPRLPASLAARGHRRTGAAARPERRRRRDSAIQAKSEVGVPGRRHKN